MTELLCLKKSEKKCRMLRRRTFNAFGVFSLHEGSFASPFLAPSTLSHVSGWSLGLQLMNFGSDPAILASNSRHCNYHTKRLASKENDELKRKFKEEVTRRGHDEVIRGNSMRPMYYCPVLHGVSACVLRLSGLYSRK